MICTVIFPFAALLAQTGQGPVLANMDFASSPGKLTMRLNFTGTPSIDDVRVKGVDYPKRYIVSVSPATVSDRFSEGVIYQDILSDGSMGVERIEFLYDHTRDNLAFIAYPIEGLAIDVGVGNGGTVTVSYTRIALETEATSEIYFKYPLPKIEPALPEAAKFENFFSLDKAALHLTPESESIIRSYFSKKKGDDTGAKGEGTASSDFSTGDMQPAAKAMARPEYRLQMGDKLALGVAGEPELDMTVQVRPDGFISFPIVGDIYVEGKTADEVRHALKRALQPYYNYDIMVNVIVTEFTPEKVYLLGKAFDAGPYPYKPGLTVLDLVGHYDETEVDISKVKLIRGDKVFPIDLKALYDGKVWLNYELEPGDYIVLPTRILPKASVLGKVKRAGEYPYEEGQRLYDLIGIAGGFDERCDIKNILIMRINERGLFDGRIYNLLSYQRDGDISQNPMIFKDDIIVVPEIGRANWDKVIRTLDSLNTFAFWWRL